MDIYVFEKFNQKIMYVKDINLYFEIESDMLPGRYKYSQEYFLTLVKEKPDLIDSLSSIDSIKYSMRFDKTAEQKYAMHSVYVLCLQPSRQCNHTCKYCSKNNNEDLNSDSITFETAKAALDFLVYDLGKNASGYVLDLAGSSEPIIDFELLKQIAEYCEKLRTETGKNIVMMFTTNATLLTKEHVVYIENDPHILPVISIDMRSLDSEASLHKEAHDTNRLYSDGNGAYDDIIKGLSLFKNKKVRLAVTITPKNMDVHKIYEQLYSLPNVDCVSMRYSGIFDGSEYDFSNLNIDYLIKGYENICKSIFRDLSNGDSDSLIKLVKADDMFGEYVTMAFSRFMKTHYRCDAGKSMIAVDNNGDIYSCPEMMGDSAFHIGNVKTGIDAGKREKFWDTTIKNNCHDCYASPVCGGECYAVSHQNFGTYHNQYEHKCKLEKAFIELAIGFVTKLKKEYYDKRKELYKFIVVEAGRSSTSDAGEWAILHLLNSDNMKITYSQVSNNIRKDSYGVHPSSLLSYLSPYYENISAFQLESPESYRELENFPAVSYLNKQLKPEHDYAMILGMNNDHLLVKIMTETDVFEVPIDEYYNWHSDLVISKY